MEWTTTDSVLKCRHGGRVGTVNRQDWVHIDAPVMVDDDPEGRGIAGCPNTGPGIRPCVTTLRATTGYSEWIRIDGHAVVLSHLDGLTDGTPPGTVHYRVADPRQLFVRAGR